MTGDWRGRTVLADWFHAPERDGFEALGQALIALDEDGRISRIIRREAPDWQAVREAAETAGTLVVVPAGQKVLPGFVDCHVHAPQYRQAGEALDVPLKDWLLRHTFPLEARFEDLEFARETYSALVADLLANGTTTALYFATLHVPATQLLVDICLEQGQRALVGKVAMDHADSCPDYYRDASPEAAVAGTRAVIDYVRGHPENGEGLVQPVITPRFIPACSDEALAGLGALVAQTGAHVQTHCSESDWAHGYVLARHGMTDTRSLDRFGLLTRRSVVAHANFIDERDMDLLRQRGSAVAHCPHSNAYFANAVFPLREALQRGLRVGLGTDISGGPDASIFDAQRMAVAASRMLETGVDPRLEKAERGRPQSRIDIFTAFHLATAGGADALDLPTGRFAPGCHLDAIVIDTEAAGGTIRLFGTTEPAAVLEKVLRTASRGNIARVLVGGRQIAGTTGQV